MNTKTLKALKTLTFVRIALQTAGDSIQSDILSHDIPGPAADLHLEPGRAPFQNRHFGPRAVFRKNLIFLSGAGTKVYRAVPGIFNMCLFTGCRF